MLRLLVWLLVWQVRIVVQAQTQLKLNKQFGALAINTTNLEQILSGRCCNNPFVFVKRYEKGFFNQINAYLSVTQIATYTSLTHIAPDFVSNYLESNLKSRAKPCRDAYSNESIRVSRNRNCALDVPFEEVVDLTSWQRGLVRWDEEKEGGINNMDHTSNMRNEGKGDPLPFHCLLSVFQAQRLCHLPNLRSLSPSAMYPPTKYFFNATTFTDPQQTLALRHWVASRPHHMLYLHGRYARRVVIKIPHDAFQSYRKNRLREIAFLQPGPLLQPYVEAALGHVLLRGGYNALHLRLEKDMLASFMVDGWTDKLNMDYVVTYLQTYLPSFSSFDQEGAALPLYVAYSGELPVAYRHVLEDAGYKVVTKGDIWSAGGMG
ncbi:hypothetical protein EON65_36810, partial [archaeon]